MFYIIAGFGKPAVIVMFYISGSDREATSLSLSFCWFGLRQ
jgi:hypothetical protein